MTGHTGPAESLWRARVAQVLLPLLGFFATSLVLQVAAHAYTAELAGADEPAHFITALLIRDYLGQGLPAPPLAFAENYYVHYPKVALPIWPPVFHAMASTWMLVFPATIGSVRVLVALVTAVAGLLLYRMTTDDLGRATALALGFGFIALPQTQSITQQVMVDGLVTALALAAALVWRRYSRTLAPRDSLWFGLLGAAAMLPKGNGVALLALPVAWALLANRIDVLGRRATWYGPALMLVVGGPWTVYSLRLLQRTVVNAGARGTLGSRASAYGNYLLEGVGPVVLVAAAIGLVAVVATRFRRDTLPDTWAVLVAMAIAVAGFHVVLPQPANWRYLLPLLPACLWLAVRGVHALGAAVPPRIRAGVMALAALALVAGVAERASGAGDGQHHGIGAIAEWVVGQPPGVVLVSDGDSGVNTAGMFIAELAVREARPGHIVLRGNKTLSTSTWDGQQPQLRHGTTPAILAYLASIPVRYVILDDGPTAGAAVPANELLRAALRDDSTGWKLAATFPDAANPQHRRLAFETRTAPGPPGPISIDMRHTLGRSITLGAPR